MKQFILYTIFCNVFVLPWGMSQIGTSLGEIGSVVSLLAKFLLVALVVIVIETVQSRLRFYRYQEPLAAGFMFAVLAIVSSQLL
jgi:formate hydrogenlyase subunit 4